jgi:hypothetical protein
MRSLLVRLRKDRTFSFSPFLLLVDLVEVAILVARSKKLFNKKFQSDRAKIYPSRYAKPQLLTKSPYLHLERAIAVQHLHPYPFLPNQDT